MATTRAPCRKSAPCSMPLRTRSRPRPRTRYRGRALSTGRLPRTRHPRLWAARAPNTGKRLPTGPATEPTASSPLMRSLYLSVFFWYLTRNASGRNSCRLKMKDSLVSLLGRGCASVSLAACLMFLHAPRLPSSLYRSFVCCFLPCLRSLSVLSPLIRASDSPHACSFTEFNVCQQRFAIDCASGAVRVRVVMMSG